MKRMRSNGKLFINLMQGTLHLISKNGRLVYPVELIESKTAMHKRVKNSIELLKTIRQLQKNRKHFLSAKHQLLEMKIDTFLQHKD